MKKIKLIPFLLCFLLLSGCWSSREISRLSIVLGIGFEKTEDGNVEVIAQVAVPSNISSKNGSSSGDKNFINYVVKEENIFDAVQGTTNKSASKLSLSHNILILIGRKAAEDGIYKYMDFFIREHEIRLNTPIVVVDGEMDEVLKISSEILKVPCEYINTLIDIQGKSVGGGKVRLLDFMNHLQLETCGYLLPMVRIDEKSDPPALVLDQTAVFLSDKMVGTITIDTFRGAMFVNDKVEGGAVIVGEDDKTIGFKLDSSKTKISVNTDDDKVNIEIKITTNVHVHIDSENRIKTEGMDKTKKELEDKIREQVQNAIDIAKVQGVDFFHFGEEVYKKNPTYWKNIKNDWGEIFKGIQPTIKVECKIEDIGLLLETALKKREE